MQISSVSHPVLKEESTRKQIVKYLDKGDEKGAVELASQWKRSSISDVAKAQRIMVIASEKGFAKLAKTLLESVSEDFNSDFEVSQLFRGVESTSKPFTIFFDHFFVRGQMDRLLKIAFGQGVFGRAYFGSTDPNGRETFIKEYKEFYEKTKVTLIVELDVVMPVTVLRDLIIEYYGILPDPKTLK